MVIGTRVSQPLWITTLGCDAQIHHASDTSNKKAAFSGGLKWWHRGQSGLWTTRIARRLLEDEGVKYRVFEDWNILETAYGCR